MDENQYHCAFENLSNVKRTQCHLGPIHEIGTNFYGQVIFMNAYRVIQLHDSSSLHGIIPFTVMKC